MQLLKEPSFVASFVASVVLALGTGLLVRSTGTRMRADMGVALSAIRDVGVRTVRWEVEREMKTVTLLANAGASRVHAVSLLEGNPASLSALDAYLSPVMDAFGYAEFYVLDEAGQLIDDVEVGSSERFRVATHGLSFVEDVQERPVISAPVRVRARRNSGQAFDTITFVGAPLHDRDGQSIGALVFELDTRPHLVESIDGLDFGRFGEVYLFSADGLMLSDSRFEEDLVPLGLVQEEGGEDYLIHLRDPERVLTNEAPLERPAETLRLTENVARARTEPVGVDTYGYRDYRGVKVVGSWSWLEEYGVGVAVEIDARGALANLRVVQASFVITFLLMSFTLFALAFVVARARRRLVGFNRTLEQRVEARTAEANQASAAKSEFLARMSHEIRTPLNAVLGMAHLAKRDSDDPNVQRQMSRIEASGASLLTIINDILDFSKIEAGALVLDEMVFDLEHMLRDLGHLEITAQPGVELIFDCATDVPRWVVGDPGRLRQILVNLVGNAFKFTKDGSVTVRLRKLAEAADTLELEFAVIDTGVGIDEETAEQLFSAFQQADGSTTRAFGGTGLGLAISRRIAEAMGGTVDATGSVGVGSTFRATARFGTVERPAWDADTFALLKGRRALVVDDSPAWRSILSDSLDGFGLNVTVAENGHRAVEIVEDSGEPFDIAIVDWLMPGMDGLETCRKLQSTAGASTVMMVTSAERTRLTNLAGRELPHVLGKPFTRSALLEQVLEGLELGVANAGRTPSAPRLMPRPGLRVLLVEDHPINQEVGVGILEGAGVEVSIASNGAMALEMLADAPFDVVLMDVQMPIMDGWEATRRIREDERFAELPIIAMTADVLAEDRQRCFDAGMNAYIAKPFTPGELVALVAKWSLVDAPVSASSSGPTPIRDVWIAGASERHTSISGDIPAYTPRRAVSSINDTVRAEPPLVTPPEGSAIDEAQALALLDDDRDMWLDLLGSFESELDQMADVLSSAPPVEDPGAVRRVLHTLKGLAPTLGGTRLANVAAQLEANLAPGEALERASRDRILGEFARFRSESAKIRGVQ